MSAQPFTVEPVVEELIQEIAQDPRSSFFQVDRPSSPRGFLQSWDTYSPVSAGWTAAERHLLEVHREEAAFWLRCKIMVEARALEQESGRIDHRLSVDDTTPTPDRRWWNEQQRQLDFSTLSPDADYHDALESALKRRTWSSGGLYELSTISARLSPCDTAWLRVGLCLGQMGHSATRIQLLRRRLVFVGADTMKSFFWESLASEHDRCGDYPAALRAYSRASALGPPRVCPMANAMAEAIIVSNYPAALRLASLIDSTVSPDHQALQTYLTYQATTLRSRSWEGMAESRKIASELSCSIGPASRRISNGFL